MPEFQEKPLHELLSRSMVDLYVGPEKTHWILHSKLLCHHSAFFRAKLQSKDTKKAARSLELADEEDGPFRAFVGWLYAGTVPAAREEGELSVLLELYLMAEKWGIGALAHDAVQAVREWYRASDTYPSLRRVQYVYANTADGCAMRRLLVHAVARLLVLEKGGVPAHWDKALRKNGRLAVDIIAAIRDWRLDEDLVPDAREGFDELAEDEEIQGGEEVEDEIEDEVEDDVQDEEEEDEAVEPEHDDGEDTVVESPGAEVKMPKGFGGAKQGDDLAHGFQKMGLEAVPNGISKGDFGTLGH